MIEAYERDGFAVWPGLIPAELVERVRDEAYRLYTANSGNFGPLGAFVHTDGTHYHRKHVHTIDCVRQVIDRLPLEDVLGDGPWAITHSKFSYKRFGAQKFWAPHQDAGYKPEPRRGCTFAVLLEPCGVINGTIEFAAGSHHGGLRKHRNITAEQIVCDEAPGDSYTYFAGAAGDVAAFHLQTVHRSGANTSQGLRAILFVEIEPYKDSLRDDLLAHPVVLRGGG